MYSNHFHTSGFYLFIVRSFKMEYRKKEIINEIIEKALRTRLGEF